jgi:AraC-like DNA-binding protein
MESGASPSVVVRFSTQDLPVTERVPYWREVFARQICHIEIEPQPDCPLEADATMLAMPNLNAGRCNSASPACWKRTPEQVKDGSDDFALLMPIGGAMMRAQLGRDLEVNAGDAVGILHHEPASMRFKSLQHVVVMVPVAVLASSASNVEEASTRLVPRGTEAVRLLTGYLLTLFSNPVISDPAVCKVFATHIYDLVAMAIGATREGQEVAFNRGMRAARLNAIKSDFDKNPASTLSAIAARQRVTPRYVQMLFEENGTTFSAYSLDRRLRSARGMLSNPSFAGWTISAIAFEAGFGDLSHFNRSFRRRYGASPSDVRAESLRLTRQNGKND